jgi:hypothetical protein
LRSIAFASFSAGNGKITLFGFACRKRAFYRGCSGFFGFSCVCGFGGFVFCFGFGGFVFCFGVGGFVFCFGFGVGGVVVCVCVVVVCF